jgi:prephenate dehydrogenase
VLGHDKDGTAAQTAAGMGAVDGSTGLKEAVKDSQVVFLCLPLSEMRETLGRIGPMLRENAVVLDTAPIRGRFIQWARESLPPGRYHIGLVPSLNPSILANQERGPKAAQPDLFHRSVMMVVSTPDTPEPVEELGMNVVRLLGAKPMLTDPAEADGIMTTAHLLPQLAASALIEACTGTEGWIEARKLAGRPFANATGEIAYYDDPASLQEAALTDPARVVHGLDVLIASLTGLRDQISGGETDEVGRRLAHGRKARDGWLDERTGAAWLTEGREPLEVPSLGDQITQMFFGGRIAEATKAVGAKRESRR